MTDIANNRFAAAYAAAKDQLDAHRKLQQEQASLRRFAYLEAPKLCRRCGLPLTYEQRKRNFCSMSCAKTGRVRTVSKPCAVCSTMFEPWRAKSRFCSRECSVRHQFGTDVHSGKIGAVAARRHMIVQHGAKCMDCGWDKINPKSGKCPIELEHIDGDSTNNRPENLKLLCPNCHSLTPTYKALNKGSGRHKRRLRYQEGKSY